MARTIIVSMRGEWSRVKSREYRLEREEWRVEWRVASGWESREYRVES